ncbi:10223_t:CDS:2 [Diversispora eburnea]|uniref:protein-tyrosine-phosphatase n=1 Tax=Diversispora eburnea TaxID=1213867 RepID=A0A9N8W1E0_9GLOM|nr:10223_t:CDS:2 [Diversispora eburnea]
MAVYRKRRLSKIPAPVIIPPPSPTVTAASPVSPDLFSELPSPRAPQSPTKRFVLKPITALTAAFQRTSITGRSSGSIRKRAESPTRIFNLKPPKSTSSCKKALPITPAELSERLHEHICESFNVNLPTLLIKRYHRGNMSNFSLDSFITTPESRDQYLDRIQEDGGKYYHDIIIFDDAMNETDKVSPGWTLLIQNRGRVYWLKGGFEAFRSWDQKREFIITGLEVGSVFSNNENGNGNENESDGLVRRDSLFSVNTERSSLRRKRSDKNNSEIQDEIPKGRRPSNGLQYLFTPSTSTERRMSEPLSLFPNQFVKTNNLPDCPDSPSTPPPLTHPEISFIVSTIIPDFLYLGPEISKKEEVEELESKGVKRILNMAFECVDNLGLNEKFEQYLKLNVKDSVEEDVESGLKVAVDFIEQAEKDQTPIYVHCKAGKSRSVTAVLAFLIKSRHWTLRHAYDYVMERRSGICPNIGFVAELMRVEELVLGIKSNTGAITEFDLRRKDDMMDVEGIEPVINGIITIHYVIRDV